MSSELVAECMRVETGLMAAKLLRLLESTLPGADGALADGAAFLRARSVGAAEARAAEAVREQATDAPPLPLDRLVAGFGLRQLEAALLVLAGLPDEHEGYAALLRALHPRNEPWATVGLAARLLVQEHERHRLRDLLTGGAAVTRGILRLEGEAPFFERSLCLPRSLWAALHGVERWPSGIEIWPRQPSGAHGLEAWLAKPASVRALTALRERLSATILVSGESDDALMWRALALVARAERKAVGILCAAAPDASQQQLIQIHAVVSGSVPVVSLPESETAGPQTAAAGALWTMPDTVVLCTRSGQMRWNAPRPLIALPAEPLDAPARRSMWERILPGMSSHAAFLAARFPMEPASADQIATDLRALERIERRGPTLDDFLLGMRSRASLHLSGSIKLVKPAAGWDDLVLPATRLEQLREAVNRLQNQLRVLDEWGFLKGRTGSRGVRMLFSGSPGTGKTLSAEVMAHALAVDLLVVDLSRVVSKWIGETEKNLSTVFDSAERAQAVLFFDEADALFGKRTEVSDAHDRYANLETAYLLQRLERFEGLAILATNLRQNIDTAFTRRLEFAIEFDEPDRQQRHRLWRTHIPSGAPLAPDVNLLELAALYPVTGGVVRNAAVSAAFLAAADGTDITRQHLVRAVRREYEKAGRAFPGAPAGTVS
ncbi:MAG TPA: ATP-binding protein [Gammaproteobacteria bacterium]|nr:ATP-binding protein [Gammaproteobacteria bacterium]